jgi:hypothetical protein
MIKPEQIPDKVVKAAQKAWEQDAESFRPNAKSIAAAINAWPMSHIHEYSHGKISGVDIVLPLKQEDSND